MLHCYCDDAGAAAWASTGQVPSCTIYIEGLSMRQLDSAAHALGLSAEEQLAALLENEGRAPLQWRLFPALCTLVAQYATPFQAEEVGLLMRATVVMYHPPLHYAGCSCDGTSVAARVGTCECHCLCA